MFLVHTCFSETENETIQVVTSTSLAGHCSVVYVFEPEPLCKREDRLEHVAALPYGNHVAQPAPGGSADILIGVSGATASRARQPRKHRHTQMP